MINLANLLGPPAAPAPGATVAAAAHLRLALAVRGWVDPLRYMPKDVPRERAPAILDAVAPDVETDMRAQPGRWFLRDQERRRVLTTSGADALAAALAGQDPSDANDAVRQALLLRRAPIRRDQVAGLPSEVLTALGSTLTWLDPRLPWQSEARGFWAPEPDEAGAREWIAATLARRRRADDVARMTASAFHGRGSELASLASWAQEPAAPPGRGQFVYVSGVGGAGKSTLFAHLEKALAHGPQAPLMVHIDCDMPGFDPTDPVALDLALFRQLAVAAPDHAPELMERAARLSHETSEADRAYGATTRGRQASGARRVRKAEEDVQVSSYTTQESILGQKMTGREAASFEALSFMGARTLVLLFDTVELMLARARVAAALGASADAAVTATADWMASLRTLMFGSDVRVLMAGRTPPDAPEVAVFAARVASHGWKVGEPVLLDDLDREDALAMLGDLGVADESLATLVAETLPRTPLVLKIAADIIGAGGQMRDGFVAELSQSGMGSEVARRYLTARVVNHLTSPLARPYALAAMVLPKVTAPLLAGIVMPVVDERDAAAGIVRQGSPARRSHALLHSLADAGWLVRWEPDGTGFTFHAEVRRLALALMEKDPDLDALLTKLRERALTYHRNRRTILDATLRAYYEILLDVPRTGQRPIQPDLLGAAIEDLPAGVLAPAAGKTAAGKAASGAPRRPARTTSTTADTDWRRFVEGSGQRDGEGDRLVKRGRADAALDLYRGRPTRDHGKPPTFVLQALADSGQFRTREVHVNAIAAEIDAEMKAAGDRLPNALRSRLYWLTRFCLLARPEPLSPAHHRLLAEAAGRFSGTGPVLLFPAIAAVAEALAPKRGPIAPERWFETRGAIESETRMFLVHHLRFGFQLGWKPHLDALFVAQPDWPGIAARSLHLATRSEFDRAMRAFCDQLFPARGEPASLVEVNSFLRGLRTPVRIGLGRVLPPAEAVALLRGATTEFHRPLRAAIARLADRSAAARGGIAEAANRARQRLPLRPKEFADAEWRLRMDRNLATAMGLLIPYLDRARRLAGFCADLRASAAGEDEELKPLLDAFAKWDLAIGSGTASEWGGGPA